MLHYLRLRVKKKTREISGIFLINNTNKDAHSPAIELLTLIDVGAKDPPRLIVVAVRRGIRRKRLKVLTVSQGKIEVLV